MSASVHANHLPRKKATRGRKREKRVPLLGVGKTIVGSLLFFGVGILPCPFQRFLRFFLICFFLLLHLRKITGNIYHLFCSSDEDI